MSKLDEFLGLSDVSEIRKTIKINVNGKELELVIRPLSEDEHNSFQKRSNNITKNKITFDSGKYNDLVLANCIVEPNFNAEDFLKKAKCVDGVEFLHNKFPAGVLTDIVQKITELSGFESYEMEVENAKN